MSPWPPPPSITLPRALCPRRSSARSALRPGRPVAGSLASFPSLLKRHLLRSHSRGRPAHTRTPTSFPPVSGQAPSLLGGAGGILCVCWFAHLGASQVELETPLNPMEGGRRGDCRKRKSSRERRAAGSPRAGAHRGARLGRQRDHHSPQPPGDLRGDREAPATWSHRVWLSQGLWP